MARHKTFTHDDLHFMFATYVYDGLVSGVALYKNRPVYLNSESRKGGDNWKDPRTYSVRPLTDEQYFEMKGRADKFTEMVGNTMVLNPDGSFMEIHLQPANTRRQFYDNYDINCHMKLDKILKDEAPILGWFKFDKNFVYRKDLSVAK